MSTKKKTASTQNKLLKQGDTLKRYPLVPTCFAVYSAYLAGANSPSKIAEYLQRHKDFLGSAIKEFGSCPPLGADEILILLKMVRVKYVEEEFDELVSQIHRDISRGQYPRVNACFPDGAHCVILELDKKEEWSCYEIRRLVDWFAPEGCTASSDDYSDAYLAKVITSSEADFCLKVDAPKLQEAAAAAFERPKVPAVSEEIQMPLPDVTVKSLRVSALPIAAMNRRSLGLWREGTCTIFRAQSSCSKDGVVTKSNETFYLSSLYFEDPSIARYGLDVIKFHEPNPSCARIYLNFGQEVLRVKNRNYAKNAEDLNLRAEKVAEMVSNNLKRENKANTPARVQKILSKDPQEVLTRFGYILLGFRQAENMFLFGGGLFGDPDDEDEDPDWY